MRDEGFCRGFPIIIIGLCAATLCGVLRAQNPTPGGKKAQENDWLSLTTGQEIYRAACASCHGSDGRGNRQSMIAFDVPVPDFNDCGFASREPHADWFAIAHNGGPTRGFDELMPAFGGAITDEQIDLAAGYVKDFCKDDLWPDGVFNLPRPLVTGKAFLEDEFVMELESTTGEPLEMKATFLLEKRVGARNQLEVVIPVVAKQVETVDESGDTGLRWGEGFGDLGLAWKTAVFDNMNMGTIASLGLEAFVPLGDEQDGTGKGIFRFEPFLAVGQIIPGNNFLQLQAGAELSTDLDVAKHEIFWRGALGHSFTQGRFGRTWSPMVEILGARELESGAKVQWAVVPELHVTLNQRQHVMMVLGAELPVTDFETEKITVMLHFLWDWFDGGLTDGW